MKVFGLMEFAFYFKSTIFFVKFMNSFINPNQELQTRQPLPFLVRPLGRLPDVLPVGHVAPKVLRPRPQHDRGSGGNDH
jgi:hypothetical protein